VRAVGLGADVVVVTSAVWQTTCTLVSGGSEAFLIDSPVLPAELEVLPSVAEQAGFRVVGALATHADWDHVLGRLAFAEAPLGCSPDSLRRLRSGEAQRDLRSFDDQWYLERAAPLSLGGLQELPVPGRLDVGSRELELHPAPGHTADGMAVWMPWARVLCPGDYLSPVEIPMVEGEVADYLATLDRLEPLVDEAEWVVPGHGGPIEAPRAAAILREDRAYVAGLPDAPLPLARRTGEQRRIHAENVARLVVGPGAAPPGPAPGPDPGPAQGSDPGAGAGPAGG
jgi:glyoxylase-like metal-dependent hydrolase (beta-lactamase superfamily II)